MRENHYAISCSFWEFPTFSNYKISITLLIFQNVLTDKNLSNTKLQKYSE